MASGKNYKWLAVGLLWGVALLNYMDRQMLATMRPSMQLDIPELRSATNFGYLMSIFLWIYAFMSPVSGIAALKINRKWLIVFSLFVWSAVTFSMGYARSFNQLYFLRALMGISEALYLPAGLSLIAELHSDKSRSLAIGIHMTGLYVGQAIGGFGATVASNYSWQATFHSFGLVGIIYAVILLLFLKSNNGQSTANSHTAKKLSLKHGLGFLFTNPSFWIIMLVFAIVSLPGWATKNWLPTLFANNLHIDMALAGPLSTITIAASSLAGVIAGGILSDRWVQNNVRARVNISVAGLSLTVPALLLLGFGHSLFTAAGAAICFGLGYGMFDANNMPILCQFVSAKYRATAYGLMNMTGVIAGALITGLLGRSSDEGKLGFNFALLAFIVLVVIIIEACFLHPKMKEYLVEG